MTTCPHSNSFFAGAQSATANIHPQPFVALSGLVGAIMLYVRVFIYNLYGAVSSVFLAHFLSIWLCRCYNLLYIAMFLFTGVLCCLSHNRMHCSTNWLLGMWYWFDVILNLSSLFNIIFYTKSDIMAMPDLDIKDVRRFCDLANRIEQTNFWMNDIFGPYKQYLRQDEHK